MIIGSLLFLTVFFFFSSRRRHTRWPRDWSSDVCSSDFKVKIGGVAYLLKAECIGTVVIDLNQQIPEIVTVVFTDALAQDLRIRFRQEKTYIDASQFLPILPHVILPLGGNQFATT